MAKQTKNNGGRLPIDIAAQAKYGNHDNIWKAIRSFKSKPFTSRELTCRMVSNGVEHVTKDAVGSYLTRLVKAGILSSDKTPLIKQGARYKVSYTLEKNCGREAPKLRSDGTTSKQGMGNEQMWRSMKVLGKFNALQLSVSASTEETIVKQSAAKNYVHHLHKAGYLKLVVKSKPGTEAIYLLINSKNTGPYPPQIQRTKRVFDPNLNSVVWSEDDDISNG